MDGSDDHCRHRHPCLYPLPHVGRHAHPRQLQGHRGGVLQVRTALAYCPPVLPWRTAWGAAPPPPCLRLLADSCPLLLPHPSLCCCSRDYTAAEREQGLHRAILNWASESRSNRGFKEQLAKLDVETTPAAAAAV
jgi:hypothetical protein